MNKIIKSVLVALFAAATAKASAALRDGRSSKRTKSIAASALSQREKKSK